MTPFADLFRIKENHRSWHKLTDCYGRFFYVLRLLVLANKWQKTLTAFLPRNGSGRFAFFFCILALTLLWFIIRFIRTLIVWLRLWLFYTFIIFCFKIGTERRAICQCLVVIRYSITLEPIYLSSLFGSVASLASAGPIVTRLQRHG